VNKVTLLPLCAQNFHVKFLRNFNVYVAVGEDHAMWHQKNSIGNMYIYCLLTYLLSYLLT